MSATVYTPVYQDSEQRRKRRDIKLLTPTLQRMLLGLAIVLTLVLLAVGSRMLLAGIASYQADAFLEDWSAKAEEPSERAWQIAHEAAQRAIDLYPTANGVYLERLGLIQQWKEFRRPFGAPQAMGSRQAAAQAFREAIAIRPNWPDNWAALAHAKLYLSEFDTEFRHALAQAHALAPWRIGVNSRLAEIGFITWQQLDVMERESILESARRTVAYSPVESKKLFAIATNTGMTDTLCNSLPKALKTIRKICH